jgi:pimeloyl-ACP methyl ester carboxylesterase
VVLLYALGFTVMIYDYPGFGRSEGAPSEEGVFASAQAVLEELASMPELEGTRIWLYGYSLGGAPTFELAARSERGDAPAIAGMITESAFCSVEDLVQDGAEVDVPGSLFTELRLDNCARMHELASTPVMLMHGTDDTTVPIRHLTLLEAAATIPLEVHRVEGAGHTNLPAVAGAVYASWIESFVRGR